jgi:hypothetical protein
MTEGAIINHRNPHEHLHAGFASDRFMPEAIVTLQPGIERERSAHFTNAISNEMCPPPFPSYSFLVYSLLSHPVVTGGNLTDHH